LIPRKFVLIMIAISLILVVAACDNSATPPAGNNNSPGGSRSPVAPPATPAPRSTVITFETTGGVAGVHKLLEISQGKAKFKSGAVSKGGDVADGTYNSLLQQIKTADFFNLKDSYDNGKVSDDIYYNITVKEPTRTKTIKVAQVGGKDITPKPLQDLITQLNNAQSIFEK
jgi:hypothetical protein